MCFRWKAFGLRPPTPSRLIGLTRISSFIELPLLKAEFMPNQIRINLSAIFSLNYQSSLTQKMDQNAKTKINKKFKMIFQSDTFICNCFEIIIEKRVFK